MVTSVADPDLLCTESTGSDLINVSHSTNKTLECIVPFEKGI